MWPAYFTWLDWVAVVAAVVLVGYVVWGIWRLRVIEWPDIDEDVGE